MNHSFSRPVTAQSTVLSLQRASLAALLVASFATAIVRADDAAPPSSAAGSPAGGASAAEPVRSVFIDVSGKVQWRANEQDKWHDAQVNDEVQPGVEVRTGLRSRATLRVGRNATVLVDAGTLFQLPTVVQDGEVLRTTAAVKHGRADFKVDKVGLSNDFKVVTPSTTLAVRGTEFAVATGALKQVEVVGARRNTIAAIELKYALTNSTVQMSGASASSSSVHQPAHSAAEGATAPNAAGTGTPATSQSERVQEAALGASPVRPGSPAEATAGNRASARNEKASGRTSGVVGAARGRAEAAAALVEQAIAYLAQSEDSLDGIQANRDALNSLRLLAVARRDDATDALSAHEAAYGAAQELGSVGDAAEAAFDELSTGVHVDLSTFDDRLAEATDALDAIRIILDDGRPPQSEDAMVLGSFGGGEGGGDGDLDELIEAARAALLGMADAHDSASAGLLSMADQRDTLAAVVAELHAGARGQARTAAAAYQVAVTRLAALVQTGASESAVATAARATIARLQGLIAAIAQSQPNPRTVALARQALARLESATDALSRASGYLAAIRAARDAAAGDPRAAVLGEVEALYERLLAARVRVVGEWLTLSAGVDQRGSQLEAALSDAEDLAIILTNRFVVQGSAGEAEANAFADEADAIAAGSGVLADAEAAALADAEALEVLADAGREAVLAADAALASELGAFDAAAADSETRLAALEAAGIEERLAQVDGAIEALDAMDTALVGVLARATDLDGAIAGAVDLEAFDDIAARASEAVGALLAAEEAMTAAVDGALGGGDAAALAAARSGRLLEIAQEFQRRFGFSTSFAEAAVRATSALAASANAAGDRALAAQRIIAGLAAIARSDRVGTVLARIESVIAANDRTGSAAAALIARAEASYVSINEAGTSTFRLMTVDSRDAASAEQATALAQLDGLSSMSVVSGQMVAALDGAEVAADNAERSLASALLMRTEAETNEGSAANGLFRTQLALDAGNVTGAATESSLTAGFATAARTAATAATGHADEAKRQSDLAVGFAADVNRLRPDVEAFGANRPAFEAGAASRRASVDSAKERGDQLAADAAFYDSVAQALAGRAGTAVAAGHAANSDAARAQAAAIARQLGTMASQAAVLAETATTNAGRLFGRSVAEYVGRAQAAAAGAEVHAIAANAAATRAEGSASTAAGLVRDAQNSN